MKPKILDWLACPRCHNSFLPPEIQEDNRGEIERGILPCGVCGARYPILRGIPRLLPEDFEGYTESFGIQWQRYEVQRPDEDRATFFAKTGFHPEGLRGALVLDAGCGSGRYAVQAAELGAEILAVDGSAAVEKAREVCRGLPKVHVIQGDLVRHPFRPNLFDRIFSIGVLDHTPDTRQAFRALAPLLRQGGEMAIWLYRRNWAFQEALNSAARAITIRLGDPALRGLAFGGAVLGGIPGLRTVLSKLLCLSTHPDFRIRRCDNFDWYSPRYQFHHTEEEVLGWFQEAGFQETRVLHGSLKTGRLYDWALQHNLIIGSGVNVWGKSAVEKGEARSFPVAGPTESGTVS